MLIEFQKMHGLGNDFMLAEWPQDRAAPSPQIIARWAHRHEGVGFDQLLLVTRNGSAQADASYRVFNADGGEVEQCGNGARCIASFLSAVPGTELRLGSAGGMILAQILGDGLVRISYGEPDFRPESLPFEAAEPRERYRLSLNAGDVEFGIASMGNPHAVIEVDSVDRAPVGILGAELARCPSFPQGVNVGFMQRDDDAHIRLRVYERGVGETQACGTGAAAAVAVGRRWGILAARVEVGLLGGSLTVDWPGPGEALWQTGPTTKVYEGRIEL